MAEHVCPYWVGYLLASPIRRLFENPQKMLGEYIEPGMTVADIGCAMGFFSLWLARMAGQDGRVVCVDVQARMIEALMRRAIKAGLMERIVTRVCEPGNLGIDDFTGRIDFALACHVVHEVPDVPVFMTQMHTLLKPGAHFYIAEPNGHVLSEDFTKTEVIAQRAGFVLVERPRLRRSRAAVFVKQAGNQS